MFALCFSDMHELEITSQQDAIMADVYLVWDVHPKADSLEVRLTSTHPVCI